MLRRHDGIRRGRAAVSSHVLAGGWAVGAVAERESYEAPPHRLEESRREPWPQPPELLLRRQGRLLFPDEPVKPQAAPLKYLPCWTGLRTETAAAHRAENRVWITLLVLGAASILLALT